MTVLILGGTAEARDLANRLVRQGRRVVSSLAGRVANPALPYGEVRIGGFGGCSGLVTYLMDRSIVAVVDATHPFATRISGNALTACADASVPLLRLARPGWSGHAGAPTWHWTSTYDDLRSTAERLGSRPFLTTGRQSVPHFARWSDRYVLLRVVDPLADGRPDPWEVVVARGPYAQAAERDLMETRRIDVLLTKDSGGTHTAGKLAAAADLAIPVVVLARPASAPHVATVADTDAAVLWLGGVFPTTG